MNFDPTLQTNTALFLGFLAAAMWGTWFISLKYIGDYPIEAFYLTLFITSLILVWGIGFILDGKSLLTNIREIWAAEPSRVTVTFLCGVLYVLGIQLSLRVIKIIGLSLSQPLQASINLVGGTLVSGLIGGVPAEMNLMRVWGSALFLMAAITLTMKAGSTRDRAQEEKQVHTGLSRDPKALRKAIIMMVVASGFVPAYSMALAYGLKSITQPHGLAVMPFMAVLCSGAFVGASIICGVGLTFSKQWHVFKQYGMKIHKYGILSGLAHYGGNIIHALATRNLSSIVSWPLGVTAGLWTTLWGLVYGEFKGSPKKTYIYLFGGVLCYLAGALIISNII